MPRIDTPKRSLALVLALAAALVAAPRPARAEAGSLNFLARPDGTLVGPLEEADPDGLLCPGCGPLPEMTLDEAILPVVFDSREGPRVAAAFGGLQDGRHTAHEFLPGPGNDQTQAQDRLFVVDTLPPVLELLRPQGGVLSPGEAVFWVRIQDAGSGLPPTAETLQVEATLNGEELLWKLGSQAGERLLILYGGHIPLPNGTGAALRLTVRDRAGNPAVLARDFVIKLPQERIESGQQLCDGEEGPRAFPVALAGEVPFGFRRLLHPLVIAPQTMEAELSFDLPLILGRPLAADIAAAIDLHCDHPAVRVQRLDAADGRSLRFRVSQAGSVPPAETLASMTLRLPRRIRFAYGYACADGHPVVAEARMEALDWESLSLPLLLDWQWTTGIRVFQEGDHLVCRVEAGTDGVVDANTSWFAVGGRQSWFEVHNPGFFEAAHGVAEGPTHFQIQLGSACGTWKGGDFQAATDDTGTVRHYAGDWLVRLGAPVIRAFRYDTLLGVFLAEIEDEGTALRDLVVQLESGGRRIECRYEETSGMFLSPPMEPPPDVAPAMLTVTDRAEQTTVQNAFWGAPLTGEPVSPSVTAYHSTIQERSLLPHDTVVEAVVEAPEEDGRSQVQVCAPKALPPRLPTPEEIRQCEGWVATGGCLRLDCDASICRQPLGPTEYARQCHWEWRDITPPAIEMVECLPDGTIRARIHDHGAPLADLQVTDSENAGVFDSLSGKFRTRADITRGEHLRVAIHARDKAGNLSSAFVDLTVPLKPPEVRLEVREVEKDGVHIAYADRSLDVLLTATARDDSGLDQRYTRPSVDHHPVPVIAVLESTQDDVQHFVFGAAGLEEGPHQAAITVADRLGLSADAQAGFEILRAPRIQDFRFLDPPDPSLPATLFSAQIADAGDDLRLEGITLHLDGQALPADRLFYHRESRYFAADGPQVLATGAHEAVLAAVDDRGHRTEASLVFAWGSAGGAVVAAAEGLILEGVEIQELRPVDADGLANPGEIVRLYFRLARPGQEALRDLTAELTALDPHLRVETTGLALGDLAAGASAWRSPKGFDLHIAAELAGISRQDPYALPLRLRITDGSGQVWDFDFELPVFRSRADAGGAIRLTLDPLARTAEPRVFLRGKAQADPEEDLEVTVQVHGSRYRADWSRFTGQYAVLADLEVGDNLIEVEARAMDGRQRTIQGRVQRLAPELAGEIRLTLDSQAATREARILLRGNARAVPEEDLEVSVEVGGVRSRADWSRSSGQYAVLVDLAVGDNPIEVAARTADGRRQRIRGRVERLEPYGPMRLSFAEPAEGAWFNGCGDIAVSGRFDSGGRSLDGLTVTVTHLGGDGGPRRIAVSVSGDGFTGVIPADLPSGFYELRGTLRAAGGETLTVVRHIEIASCT